jgi:hypothetical protein
MIILKFGSVSAQRTRVKQLLWAFVKDPPAKQRRFALHFLSYWLDLFCDFFIFILFPDLVIDLLILVSAV